MDMLESILMPYGLAGLFLASFMASTILPLGSEAFVILLISRGFNLFHVVVVASIGNYLGACTGYYIGLMGRTGVVEKYFGIPSARLEQAGTWFGKYGSWSLLFTWLPLVGDALPIAAGIMRLKFGIFSILVFAGKFFRYATLAYLVYAGTELL